MVTLVLEVKSRVRPEFYNPAPDKFRRYPRTMDGAQKAINDLLKLVSQDWITDYRILVYEGKYGYWKNMKPVSVVDSSGQIL